MEPSAQTANHIRPVVNTENDEQMAEYPKETSDELCCAIASHDVAKITQLLSADADPNAPNSNGRTPLQLAVEQNDCDLADPLLSAKGDPNQAIAPNGPPLLHYAASHGHNRMLLMLLKSGASVDAEAPGDGNTALAAAASAGHNGAATRLISWGAQVNHTNKLGQTPLHGATEQWREETIGLLLGHRADENRPDNTGLTPLGMAVKMNHLTEFLELLKNRVKAQTVHDGDVAISETSRAGIPQVETVDRPAVSLPRQPDVPFSGGLSVSGGQQQETVMNWPLRLEQQTVRRFLCEGLRTTGTIQPEDPANYPPSIFTTGQSTYRLGTRNPYIGGGASGHIYRFENANGDFAVKCIRLFGDGWRRLVEQEVDVLNQLGRHRSIVQFLDWTCTNEWGFIVMESLGQPLSAIIPENGFRSVEKISGILRKVLHGLERIHDKNFVHCDLKPANVVYNIDGQFKLMVDSGATVASHSPIQAYTPAYAPPNLDDGNATTAWDIWSLGIFCYVLWHGKLPSTPSVPIIGTEEGVADFNDFVAKCLVTDPLQRATVVQLMDHSMVADPSERAAAAAPMTTSIGPHTPRHISSSNNSSSTNSPNQLSDVNDTKIEENDSEDGSLYEVDGME